jgi:hypothetical protein
MLRSVIVGAIVVQLILAASVAARAQEATPAALPVTPGPDECVVAPRPAGEIADFASVTPPIFPERDPDNPPLFQSPPTRPLAEGVPDGIVATAREWVACLNAEDWPRILALFTDELLATGLFTPGESAGPRSADQQTALLAVLEPRVFEDGRVGVILVLGDQQVPRSPYAVFVVFREIDGRWLIDDIPVATFPEQGIATPTAGVPLAYPPEAIPDPSECQVEPRTREEVEALAKTTPGEVPVATPAGQAHVAPGPVSEDVRAGIAATVRERLACTHAGDGLRVAALNTDAFLAQSGITLLDEGLDQPPTPLPVEERIAFLGIPYAVAQPDGRVAAVVAIDTPEVPSPVEAWVLFFSWNGERWLFDAFDIGMMAEGSGAGGGGSAGSMEDGTAISSWVADALVFPGQVAVVGRGFRSLGDPPVASAVLTMRLFQSAANAAAAFDGVVAQLAGFPLGVAYSIAPVGPIGDQARALIGHGRVCGVEVTVAWLVVQRGNEVHAWGMAVREGDPLPFLVGLAEAWFGEGGAAPPVAQAGEPAFEPGVEPDMLAYLPVPDTESSGLLEFGAAYEWGDLSSIAMRGEFDRPPAECALAPVAA